MMLSEYELYDAIWWHRIRITQALYDHGREKVCAINLVMPNLLTHCPVASPVDEVAEFFGFDSDSDLVEYLLAYKPRGPVESRYYEQLIDNRLRVLAADMQLQEVDDVPF
jgi:hypothetical protein